MSVLTDVERWVQRKNTRAARQYDAERDDGSHSVPKQSIECAHKLPNPQRRLVGHRASLDPGTETNVEESPTYVGLRWIVSTETAAVAGDPWKFIQDIHSANFHVSIPDDICRS